MLARTRARAHASAVLMMSSTPIVLLLTTLMTSLMPRKREREGEKRTEPGGRGYSAYDASEAERPVIYSVIPPPMPNFLIFPNAYDVSDTRCPAIHHTHEISDAGGATIRRLSCHAHELGCL